MPAVPELHVRMVSSGVMAVLAAAAAVLTSIPAFCFQRLLVLRRASQTFQTRSGPGRGLAAR